MEIMKETPWSRIRGQNSVYKEFLEIVDNGSPTGSVLEETIAVSATISTSVEKSTQRTLLQDLLRNRMSEKRREPEVPGEEAQVGKRLDCRPRITSKELAQLHSVKTDILRSAFSTRPRMDAD